MVTKRVLLFGGSGQIGRSLRACALPPDWHLSAPPRVECDLEDHGAIRKTMHSFAPDIVINAAAMTDIDACEQDPERALRVNFDSVATLAGHCAALNAPLIQLSTDYVFDGTDGPRPYEPDDAMNPVNAYGKSKCMAEEAARHGIHWHVILRTSLVFSSCGQNVLTKMARQIETLDDIDIAADQTASPTSAAAVADALIAISDAILNGKADGFGTFHLCGMPPVTRLDFAQAIVDAYVPATARRPRLIPVTSADRHGRVPRPLYSALDCEKTQRIYGIAPRLWRDDLLTAVKTLTESHTS